MSHAEKRLVGYSRLQLFDVVDDVAAYEEFVPWCERSRVSEHGMRNADDALVRRVEIAVGFKWFQEKYISEVRSVRPLSVYAYTAPGRVFEVIESRWEFHRGPTDSSCWVDFHVDFKFCSAIYAQVADYFLSEVVEKMISAFERRCCHKYGPPLTSIASTSASASQSAFAECSADSAVRNSTTTLHIDVARAGGSMCTPVDERNESFRRRVAATATRSELQQVHRILQYHKFQADSHTREFEFWVDVLNHLRARQAGGHHMPSQTKILDGRTNVWRAFSKHFMAPKR